MTYSSACQRVMRLSRLPTTALPATAPTLGSANQRASRGRVSGGNRVSASSATTISPLRQGQAAVQRPRLAAVLEGQQRHPRLGRRTPRAPRRRCRRSSRRRAPAPPACVQLESRIRVDRGDDHLLLVEAGDQHADHRPVVAVEHRRRAAGARGTGARRQDGQEDQPRDAQDDGDDEQRLHARR